MKPSIEAAASRSGLVTYNAPANELLAGALYSYFTHWLI